MSKNEINHRINKLFSGIQDGDELLNSAVSVQNYDQFSWESDANGLYTQCSQEVISVLGYSPEEIIGNPLLSIGLVYSEQSKLRSALQSEVFPCDVELTFLSKNGQTVATRVNLFQKSNSDGQLIGYQGIVFLLGSSKDKLDAPENPINESDIYEANAIETSDFESYQLSEGIQTGKLPEIEDTVIYSPEPISPDTKSTKKRREVKPKEITRPQKSPSQTRVIQTAPLPPIFSSIPPTPIVDIPSLSDTFTGITLQENDFTSAESTWSKQAETSLVHNETISQNGDIDNPAVIVTPLKLRDRQTAVIEVLDNAPERKWTHADRLLVQEISTQLGLALENAQLYSTIQKELRERVKAEEETLRRNRDLATLNQIGQRLSRLVGQEEIFEIITSMSQEILSQDNILVALFDSDKKLLSFPVCLVDGERQTLHARKTINGYQEAILQNKSSLLINFDLEKTITETTFDHPKNKPLSLLAVPLLTADRAIGVISIYDFDTENAFSQVQGELLSTIASQAATALENTNLFTEIRDALALIEVRELYQSNVTNAVARLSEKGSSETDFLLESLSKASSCERVFYAQADEDLKLGRVWLPKAVYNQPGFENIMPPMAFDGFPHWVETLEKKPWVSYTQSNCPEPEKQFLIDNGIQSILLFSIRLEDQPVGCIGLVNISSTMDWKSEQIDILTIATDSFNNTLIRESLLNRVQGSLAETESLYSASHQLALADDMQNMLEAVIEGTNVQAINRGVLVLFDYDNNNQISRMAVEANYYSGSGTPPPVRGTEYLVSLYKSLFIAQNPVFYDDLLEIQLEKSLQDILTRQNIRSMAVLPLWSANKQLGVMLLQCPQKHTFSPQEMRTYPPLSDQLSTSIQNLRLFEETQEALSETELLYKISSGIAKSQSMEELVRLVGENVLPQNADTLWLCTSNYNVQSKTNDIEVIGSYSSTGKYAASGIKLDPGIFSFIDFSKAEPEVFSDISKSELPGNTQGIFRNLSINAGAIFPLQTSGNPVGLLIASSKRVQEFDPDDIHTMQIVSNSIAVALERQRLLFEAQRRAVELQTAAEIARDTTSTLSLEILLNRIVNLLKDRFELYHVSIFLLDDTNTYALIQESTGSAGQELKRRNHRLAVGSKSVIGTCTSTGETVVVNDTTHSSIFYPNPLLPDTQSELGLPLKISGKVIGAIDLQSTELNAFPVEGTAILQILSDQISVAIDNARAYAISQEAVEEMRELDRVKSQFLANMSHELRTPLNSVIGFSRVILKGIDGPINDVQQQDITAIYNSGMHLLNMINEILDLSKIDAGKMELQIEELSISDIINAAITNTSGLVKDKPIELVQKVPADLPLVKADEIRISQVVINLISNAIKFTEKGSIAVEASMTTTADNKPEMLVTVTDTGMGIAVEDQAKLFQRFSQVDDSPTRKTGGTGLGLSICRSLIELHGGRIGLESSEVGKGSKFFFTLPMPDFVPGYDITQLTHGENVILAIDDDPQVISLYDRFLKTQGFEVIPLTDPSMAVQRAKELKPFAITLDVMMPQKDGWQVLTELKQDTETRDIPILICSILQEEEKGYSLGASEYLVKPFLQDDLINAIHRLNKDGSVHEVLVVDDDEDDLRLIQKMLESDMSLHLTTSTGGAEALETLLTLTPDVIILDLFMPRMNGFDLLEKFHADARLSRIPVIILTGADLDTDQQKQISEFSQHMISKSTLHESDLLKNIEQALSKIKNQQSGS
jgi:signal transduction histidine kinase/DNA-binding response OmpR family regulator